MTAVPATGYHFVNWSDASTANPRTDTGVTGDINVTANFAINTYTLTYTAGANGSISGSSPQTVNYGASGTAVTAVAATGYHFVNWSDASTANPRTDSNVQANVTVTASFALNTYTLTYTAGSHGSISGTSPQTVPAGGSGAAVTAVAATGYHFVNWSDASTANPRTDTNITGQRQRDGQLCHQHLHPDLHGRSQRVDHRHHAADGEPRGQRHGRDGGPGTGYHFVNWSDGSDGRSAHRHKRQGQRDGDGQLCHQHLHADLHGGGQRHHHRRHPQTVNYGASGTAVTAVPDTGYHFVSWSDGVLTAARTDTNVTANLTVTAHFAINTYTLTYTAGGNGTITGATRRR